MDKQVIVIAGPTGSGESTITKALLERFSNTRRLITATSRPPRSGEQEGVDYYFFSKEVFEAKIASGEILEHTYHPNRDVYYGTYEPDLREKLSQGNYVIINPDLVGTKYFKENYDAITIFIAPTSIESLMNRIRTRNPEMSEEEIENRRANAQAEVTNEQPYYDHVVVNADGELEKAIDEVIAILRAEGYTLA